MAASTSVIERLRRWMLPHTQPKNYEIEIDHQILTDLAEAADLLEEAVKVLDDCAIESWIESILASEDKLGTRIDTLLSRIRGTHDQ